MNGGIEEGRKEMTRGGGRKEPKGVGSGSKTSVQ